MTLFQTQLIKMCLLTGNIYCFRASIVLGICLLLLNLHLIKNYYGGKGDMWAIKKAARDKPTYANTKPASDTINMDILLPVLNGGEDHPIIQHYIVDDESVDSNDQSDLHAIVPNTNPVKKSRSKPSHKAVGTRILNSLNERESNITTNVKSVSVKTNSHQHEPSIPLLILFSSWDFSSEKQVMHSTIFRLWGSWRPDVKPVMFTSDPIVTSEAKSHKWDVRPVMKNPKCKGPPVMTRFYTDSFHYYDAHFYGFANSDIAFGNGLVKTLEHIRNTGKYANRSVLIVGRRTNFDFLRYKGHIDSPDKVKDLLSTGKLVVRSTDYFFTNKRFPWGKLPLLSIGRPLIVRAILGYARMHNIDIIDATRTLEALHLTTADGVKSSWNKPGVYCNEYLLKKSKDGRKLPYGFGHVECARLETFHAKDGIKIRKREANSKICKPL